jgi:hypothetical protein
VVRAVSVWLGILVLASINGAFRDLVMTPRLGDPIARAISTVLLCAVIAGVTWSSVRWLGPQTEGQAVMIGGLWLVLTLTFEFGAGHYLFHKPWQVLLADYDVRRGRIWIAVLVVTLLAPLWASRVRGLLGQ